MTNDVATEPKNGKAVRVYKVIGVNPKTVEKYCNFLKDLNERLKKNPKLALSPAFKEGRMSGTILSIMRRQDIIQEDKNGGHFISQEITYDLMVPVVEEINKYGRENYQRAQERKKQKEIKEIKSQERIKELENKELQKKFDSLFDLKEQYKVQAEENAETIEVLKEKYKNYLSPEDEKCLVDTYEERLGVITQINTEQMEEIAILNNYVEYLQKQTAKFVHEIKISGHIGKPLRRKIAQEILQLGIKNGGSTDATVLKTFIYQYLEELDNDED